MSQTTHSVPDLEELRELVAGTLELPSAEVADEADFHDELDIDSLANLEISIRLQDKYSIEVGEQEFSAVNNLIEMRAVVERKLAV